MSLSSLAQLTRSFLPGGDQAELTMTLAETARILQAAAAIGPQVAGRSAAGKAKRESAYLAFQKAAHDIAGWADYLAVLAVASRDTSGRWILVPAICAEAVRLPGGRRSRYDIDFSVLARALTRTATMRFGTLLAGELLHHNVALRATAETRGSLAVFLTALGEVRIVGSPPPRMRAEEITAIAGALFDTPAGTDPVEHRKSCHMTLGHLHKEFVDAVRTDLGRGRRRWHLSSEEREHRWQLWRPSGWPGGRPGPDVAGLLKAGMQDQAVREAAEYAHRQHRRRPHPTSGQES